MSTMCCSGMHMVNVAPNGEYVRALLLCRFMTPGRRNVFYPMAQPTICKIANKSSLKTVENEAYAWSWAIVVRLLLIRDLKRQCFWYLYQQKMTIETQRFTGLRLLIAELFWNENEARMQCRSDGQLLPVYIGHQHRQVKVRHLIYTKLVAHSHSGWLSNWTMRFPRTLHNILL